MSLLDDVSIVVTPNGYKAGTLYGVLPTATLGSELVVNSDFSSDYWWGTDPSWTISGGSANSNGTGTMYKGGVLEIGKRYKVTVDISAYTSGSLTYPNASHTLPSAIGTYTFNYTAASQTVSFSGSSFVGSIDNVSVKEFTASDMDVTRATAATRVDENGLVNYAEVLGGEEVTNGDFATDSDWSKGGGWDIIGGKAEALNINGSYLVQNINFTNAKTYKIEFSISDYLSGEVRIRFSGGAGFISTDYVSGNNTHTLYLQSIGNTVFRFQGQNNFTASIDNVSVKEVTRDNVPRIDYTGGGCPHILAEPQRTNFIPYSEDFTSWNQIANITLTQNSTTSPSGESDGTKFLSTSTGAKVRANFSAVSGTTYTLSVYCKNIDATLIKLLGYDGANEFNANLTSEVNTSTWTRISLTFTAANTATGQIQIARDLPDTESAYFWGAQLEEGSYPTSYIPTSGSTVTRNQDEFSRDGIGSLINSTEGVLFVESSVLSNDGTYKAFSLSDGTTSNTIRFYTTPTLNQLAIRVTVAGVHQFNVVYTLTDLTVLNKMALKYKSNDFAFWVNGVEVKTSTSGNTYTANTLNSLQFDRGDGVDTFFGKVKQLQVYDTALTDMQLIQLTGTAGTDFYESYSEMAESLTYTIQ